MWALLDTMIVLFEIYTHKDAVDCKSQHPNHNGLKNEIISLIKIRSEEVKSLMTLCDPTDCSLPGFSVHGIFHARILEWVTISFSRRSSWPRDWTQVSHIVGRRFTVWATRTPVSCSSFITKAKQLSEDNGKGKKKCKCSFFTQIEITALHKR